MIFFFIIVVMSSSRIKPTVGCCRKREPLSERPQPLRPLPPASGLADCPFGAGKLELQAGWSGTLGSTRDYQDVKKIEFGGWVSRVRLEAHHAEL